MLSKKKPDNEFRGFLVSAVPRGPRSARKLGPRKKNDDGQICAFELLASLAGELLKESESSTSSNGSEACNRIDKDHVKRENPNGYKLSETDANGRSYQNNMYFSDQTCNDVIPSHTKKPCNDKNRIEKRQRAMDQAELFVKSLAVVNSGRKIEPSLLRETIPSSSFYSPRNDIKLGSRDDDENFTRCNKLAARSNHFRLPSRIADQRIRKLLNSKYWKAAPKLRDCETVRAAMAGGVRKPFYRKRKSYSNRKRCYRGALYKRRRFPDHHSVVTSDGGMSSESVSNSPEKNLNLHGGPLGSSPQSSFPSEDSHVKFSINSFEVPELLIEVPENATVGSLKRSVMEALTAILGGELRVGVIHHGKKVRDDSKTLLQTGLSCKDNIDMLNFTLEPDQMETHSPPFLACDTSDLLTRLPGSPVLDQELSDDHPAAPMMKCVVDQDENNHELISSQTDMLTDEASPDSKALVVIPDFTMDPLAVVPAKPPKRSEPAQRRTRRPFSVSEVESLVKAVEDLGTGRWRDVKLRAFENADHRTYVDLKDKWKTLVHTARIAPQQRRGEPVPQELLNQVLAAQAFWSLHQAKQPGKQGAAAPKAMEIEAESFVQGVHL